MCLAHATHPRAIIPAVLAEYYKTAGMAPYNQNRGYLMSTLKRIDYPIVDGLSISYCELKKVVPSGEQ